MKGVIVVGEWGRGLTRHGGGDEMIEIAVGGGGEFEGTEADIVESLVIDAVRLVGVLDELMDGQGSVVRLHDRIGDLEREWTEEKIIIWTHKVALYGSTTVSET